MKDKKGKVVVLTHNYPTQSISTIACVASQDKKQKLLSLYANYHCENCNTEIVWQGANFVNFADGSIVVASCHEIIKNKKTFIKIYGQ